MPDLVLAETTASRNGTELVGESQDWGSNDYVFQAKTRLTSNGVTGIGGIGALGVEGRGIEADDGFAADADDIVAVQTISNRSAWTLLRRPLFRAISRDENGRAQDRVNLPALCGFGRRHVARGWREIGVTSFCG